MNPPHGSGDAAKQVLSGAFREVSCVIHDDRKLVRESECVRESDIAN